MNLLTLRNTIWVTWIASLAACAARFDDLSDDDAVEGRRVEMPAAGADREVLARGTLRGAAGYQGSGTVTIERVDGSPTLLLGPDVVFSGVPGPVAVLSDRPSIGGELAAADVRIGALPSNRGPIAIQLDEAELGRAGFWVWCEPFGVDVAYAEMAAP